MKTKVTLVALALVASIAVMSAQDKKTEATNIGSRTCYVDANKNGVCDKYEDKSCTTGNGKGLMDGSGRGNGLHNGSGKRGHYNTVGKHMYRAF